MFANTLHLSTVSPTVSASISPTTSGKISLSLIHNVRGHGKRDLQRSENKMKFMYNNVPICPLFKTNCKSRHL